MTPSAGPNRSFSNFDEASASVLKYLQSQIPFDLWSVGRVQDPHFIMLLAEDSGYGVASGMSMRWNDTLCSRMTRGEGPRAAADCSAVPAYAAAPLQSSLAVGAYLGAPILLQNGELFGTLCAMNRKPVREDLHSKLPLVELQARLIGSILSADLRNSELARSAERAYSDATTDSLTDLINRRAWDRVLANEELRCQRYGHSAFVISMDMDGLKAINDSQGHAAGDRLIRRAGKALRGAAREQDVVARLGGDEFAVLAIECDRAGGHALVKRISAALEREQICASIGYAMRLPLFGLTAAWEESDRAMYESKRQRRTLAAQIVSPVA